MTDAQRILDAIDLLTSHGYVVASSSFPQPPLTTITEKILYPEDVAKRWQVNLRTVYRQIASGKLPAFKVGNRYRIHEHDVLAREKGTNA